MVYKIIAFILLMLVSSCNKPRTIGLNNKYETHYIIYWGGGYRTTYTIYTDSLVETCSFNGTNYLIEHGNTEELVSTTAPIRIVKQLKYNSNGDAIEL